MRVAVIGLGRMGRRHVRVVRDMGMEIVGLCDQSLQSIEITREEFGIKEGVCFTDGATMLQQAHPEAVVVATTAPSHCNLVCEAARGGASFILCEKPVACSIAEAQLMIATCARSGAVLAVNHQMQFMQQYTQVKSLAASSELGGLVSIIVCGSNFGLAMNASHYFEMFRYMTDDVALSIEAWLDEERVPNPRGSQFEDRAGKVRVTGQGGISMYVDCSAGAGHGLQVVYICRLGQIFVDELSGFMRVVRREDAYRDLPTTRYGMPAVEKVAHIEPADVIAPTRSVWEAMLARQSFPSGHAGLHALQCLCAVHTSHELGGIRLQLDDARIDPARRYSWA